MTVTIIASEKQLEFFQTYETDLIQTITATKIEELGSYDLSIRFSPACDFDLIAQILFGAGVSYGLDLKFSSYDNNVSR